MKNDKKKNEISIRSSAAEYLTYVAAVGDDKDSVECKNLCYGEIMVLLCRILCDDSWKYQVIPDDEEEVKNG